MKTKILSLIIATTLTAPADAACRKYSIWNYPHPQRCPTTQVQIAEDKPIPPEKSKELPAFTVNPWYTIILTPKPGRTDEEGRADAIEILRQVMGQ